MPSTGNATIGSSDRISPPVLAVLFGKADACLVNGNLFDTMVEMNPQLRTDLVAIAESPPFLASVTCFPPGCDPELRELVVDGALALHTHPRGQQILALFGVREIRRFEESQLAQIAILLEAHRRRERESAVGGVPDVSGNR